MARRKRLSFVGALSLAKGRMSKIRMEDLKRYVKYFNEASFQEKLRAVGRLLGRNILLPVLKAYFVLKAPTTPTKEKVFIIGALGYFIMPLDFIPDFLPGLIGFSDDLVVITFILKHLEDSLTLEIERQAMSAYRRIVAPCTCKRTTVGRTMAHPMSVKE